MVYKLKCNCSQINATAVTSLVQFKRYQDFFEANVEKNIFIELPVEFPFYTWRDGNQEEKWYATKWYKCKRCGCLWEFEYPEFPANGFIRKFESGNYIERGF